MRRLFSGTPSILIFSTLLLVATPGHTQVKKQEPANSTSNSKQKSVKKMDAIIIKTSLGTIEANLYTDDAKVTVANFLKYVDEGFYKGTIFHRVIPNFMIQGGGFTKMLKRKPTNGEIKNEADNGKKNLRGTLAMARTPNPHSASSQFFINHTNNVSLDFTSKTPQGWGYAVFGEVTKGMDVVDKIAATPTTTSQSMRDVPMTPVEIESIERKPSDN